jgi:hypothetical protein
MNTLINNLYKCICVSDTSDDQESIPECDVLLYLKEEVGDYVTLNSVLNLFRPHIYRWDSLTTNQKHELITTAGWAVIFKYLTADRTITELVVEKINDCRAKFEPCSEITDEMLLPELDDYFFIHNEIHKRRCDGNDCCTCFACG